jgi:hypothetical protein
MLLKPLPDRIDHVKGNRCYTFVVLAHIYLRQFVLAQSMPAGGAAIVGVEPLAGLVIVLAGVRDIISRTIMICRDIHRIDEW